jgi:NAD-dependent histone deacetylase SIR2
MYNSSESTALLNETMCDMYCCIEAASLTQFHLVIATLTEEGHLKRLYTQNIDGIDTQLPPLKTLIPLPKKKP